MWRVNFLNPQSYYFIKAGMASDKIIYFEGKSIFINKEMRLVFIYCIFSNSAVAYIGNLCKHFLKFACVNIFLFDLFIYLFIWRNKFWILHSVTF
jgi:hypothetical protein